MTLVNLIRKRSTEHVATAISAIPATQGRESRASVAKIATVAVANLQMSESDVLTIRAWLAQIEETDPQNIADTLALARRDPEARAFFLRHAKEEKWQLKPRENHVKALLNAP
jgi:hypothetical protein